MCDQGPSLYYFKSILIKWKAVADELAGGAAFPAKTVSRRVPDKFPVPVLQASSHHLHCNRQSVYRL